MAFDEAGMEARRPRNLASAVDIGLSVVLDRPDPTAPVSTLLNEGRRQDLAFERPVGTAPNSATKSVLAAAILVDDGRPLWLGAASFDRGVGFSHEAGQITHHIGPDVDAERDYVHAVAVCQAPLVDDERSKGSATAQAGHNGSRDRYFTDGIINVGVLAPGHRRLAPK